MATDAAREKKKEIYEDAVRRGWLIENGLNRGRIVHIIEELDRLWEYDMSGETIISEVIQHLAAYYDIKEHCIAEYESKTVAQAHEMKEKSDNVMEDLKSLEQDNHELREFIAENFAKDA